MPTDFEVEGDAPRGCGDLMLIRDAGFGGVTAIRSIKVRMKPL